MASPITVAVLSPVIGGPYFGEILEGITREVGTAGGRVLLLQTLDAGRSRDEVWGATDFAARTCWDHIDAVISVTGDANAAYLEQHRALGRPVVLASASIAGFQAPTASPDNVEGIHVAIEHLIEHGHRRIGFAANLVQSDMRERHDAYRLALLAHGIDADPAWLFRASDNGEIGGRGVGQDLIAAGMPVTALLAATDRTAIGVMEACAAGGASVPGDLAVIGFDDIERGSFFSPTLSTVCQHFDQVGALAARLVLAQIAGEPVGFYAHRPSSTFVPRESCGCGGDEPPTAAVVGDATNVLAQLQALLPRVDEALAGRLIAEVLEFTEAVALAASAGRNVPVARVKELAKVVREFEPAPEVLRGVVDAVTTHILGLDTDLPEDGRAVLAHCAAQLSGALWRAQAKAYLDRSTRNEASLHEQFEIGMRLLDRDRVDPRRLGWMSQTQVLAGCLALWDGDPAGGVLRVAGVYDPANSFPGFAGSIVAVEQFPPTAMMTRAGSEGRLTFVIPVRVRGRDWGLLAVVDAIDGTSAAGRHTYNQWVALLASSFEQDALQASIRGSEERYSLVARATNDGLWDWDLADDTIYYSARCTELFGRRRPAGTDMPSRWFDAVHPEDLAQLRHVLEEAANGGRRPVEIEHRVMGADGRYHHLLCRALPVGRTGGRARRMVGSLSNIDRRKQLEERLRKSALYDEVTGLPNRKLFSERLAMAIAQSHRAPCPPYAVVFLDLDGFKLVNDTLGHPVGDRLLATIGERLQAGLREVDIAARFGGDEFAVLLHDTDLDAVNEVVERLQAALAVPVDFDGHEVAITASAGVTTSRGEYDTAEDVLRDADTAMYHAKSHRRGSHALYELGMQVDGATKLDLQQGLRSALDRGQLEVHYQPIVELDTNRIDRLEALVRWRHPDQGLLAASDFVPLMDGTGLIVEMGRWVIEEVCQQLAEWRQLPTGVGLGVTVSVNVSELEFWDAGLLPHLKHCLERFGVPPECLTIEVVESVLVVEPDLAQQVMLGLHENGIGLHIDNFAASHSSLHALRVFPVQALKIDGSFIRDVATDPRTASLVEVIFAMGQALDIEVVAEGVETPAQLERLRQMGCRRAQGFLFAGAGDALTTTALLGKAPADGTVTRVSQPVVRVQAHRPAAMPQRRGPTA